MVRVDKETLPEVRMTKVEFCSFIQRLSKRVETLEREEFMGKPARRHLLRLGKGEQSLTRSLRPGDFRVIANYLERRYEAGPHVCVEGRVVKPK